MSSRPVALTIAGSDPSGGAGLQADLKTFHQHGVYGMSAVTLLTVQNTTSVSRVVTMEPSLVSEQIAACLSDIPPQAIKLGALGSAEVVRAVAEALRSYEGPLVIDPVMVSKHGHALIDDDAVEACITRLFPRATLVTPNVPEALRLLRLPHDDATPQLELAATLSKRFAVTFLLKGGHLEGTRAVDILATPAGEFAHFSAPRIDTTQTHGTGCTYAAAIAANLARGLVLEDAIQAAKEWLTRALQEAPHLGRGMGPVSHFASLQ
jgi:hydroxymethylpyrimidine/phosphomethylpyrimidine kinase